MTLANATPSLPDTRSNSRHHARGVSSVCRIITSSHGNELHALLQNLRSGEDFTACSRAAWNYLKTHNAKNKPPTYYYYGIKFYLLQTPLSTRFILLENEKKKKQILNLLHASALIMFMLTAGSKFSSRNIICQKRRKETTRNIPGIRGLRRSNPMICYTA